MYRPPSSGEDVGKKINQDIEKKGTISIIMADFNIQVDWENQVGSGYYEKEFVEYLLDSLLEHIVVELTRKRVIPGLVMCNETDLIRELKVKEPLGGNDHHMIEFTLQFGREKLESDVTVLHLSKGNYRDMREELARVVWKGSLAGMMVEQQWQEFLGYLG
eukprot:g34249.t1